MTTAEKAAFAAELEQWINANPEYTAQNLKDWIDGKLRDLRRQLEATLFVQFVWDSLHGSGTLSARCAYVADEFSSQSVPSDLDLAGA